MLLRTFFQCWLWVAIAIALFLGAWEVLAYLIRGPREKAAGRPDPAQTEPDEWESLPEEEKEELRRFFK
jgi:hypothetical protein